MVEEARSISQMSEEIKKKVLQTSPGYNNSKASAIKPIQQMVNNKSEETPREAREDRVTI